MSLNLIIWHGVLLLSTIYICASATFAVATIITNHYPFQFTHQFLSKQINVGFFHSHSVPMLIYLILIRHVYNNKKKIEDEKKNKRKILSLATQILIVEPDGKKQKKCKKIELRIMRLYQIRMLGTG